MYGLLPLLAVSGPGPESTDPWTVMAWLFGALVGGAVGLLTLYQFGKLVLAPFLELRQLRVLVYGDPKTETEGLLKRLGRLEARLQVVEEAQAADEDNSAELYRALMAHLRDGGPIDGQG